MRAADIMTPNVITVTPDTDVAEIARLMLERRISGVPVVDNGAPVGIISESDLLRRPETGTEWHAPSWLELFLSRSSLAAEYVHTHARTAGDVMTRELVTVSEDTPGFRNRRADGAAPHQARAGDRTGRAADRHHQPGQPAARSRRRLPPSRGRAR